MLFEQGPANTLTYMVAGYIVIFGTMLIYLISLIMRTRNLRADYEVLESAEEKND